MEKDIFLWFPKNFKNREETCFDLFEKFISPHLASHQVLKEINDMPEKCEYILKKLPLEKKKYDLRNENDSR